MPVSKHRRGTKVRVRKPEAAPVVARPASMTIEELRQAVGNPARDFPAKLVVAGAWWFQQMLRRIGDRGHNLKTSRKDKREAAMLLCVAMDGEHGANDDLAPLLAAMLRPYCLAATFTQAWEQANRMPPGSVRETAARILTPPGQPAV
jgi:hypothetical protein